MLTAHYPAGRPLTFDAAPGEPSVISSTLAPLAVYSASLAAPVFLAVPTAYAVVASGMLDWTPGEWGAFFAIATPVATGIGLAIRKFVRWLFKLAADTYVEIIQKLDANRQATLGVGREVAKGTAQAVTQAATQAAASAVTQAATEAIAPAVAKAIDASPLPTSDEQKAKYASELADLMAEAMLKKINAQQAAAAEKPQALKVQT